MKHKLKNFIEDLILLTIFITILYYIIIFIMSFFDNTEISLPKVDANISIPKIDTDILIKEYIKKDKNNTIDNNTNLKKEDNISIINKNVEINKTILNIDSNISQIDDISNINNENNKTISIIDTNKPNIQKDISYDKSIKPSNTIKDIHEYIRYVNNTINNNTILLKNIKENTLNIRITVLKDGTYQNIKFVSGNTRLYYETKKAVRQSFPMKINDTIKNHFPRYLRLKITFKSI